MTNEIKKYCEGLDCAICDEKEPCIYKIANDLQEQLSRKEQECEELKIYIESNEQQVKEVEKLVMDNDRLINELDQLKQTLTEIKEIAENVIKNVSDRCIETTPMYGVHKQILQKISEVVENEKRR